MAHRPIRSVSTTTGNGREWGNAIVHTILLGGLLSLARGRRERKQRENKMRVFNEEPETFVIKMEMRLFVDEGVSSSHCLSCQPSERLL